MKVGAVNPNKLQMKLSVQVDTPDSVLQSGLGLGPGPDTALRSMVDPRDYDRLRFLQMSAAQPNTFEETIHRVSFIGWQYRV